MKDAYRIQSSALPKKTKVVAFRGREGLSRLYRFEIFLMLASEELSELDLADALGTKAELRVHEELDKAPFVFHGLLSTMELIHETPKYALFRADLVPHLSRLTLSHHCRVFVDQTVPDIMKAILEDGGLEGNDYEFRLAGAYKPREHVCQYRESNFAFFSRWLEREGMYYYFEHGEGGEKLIITDDRSFHDLLVQDPVRYDPSSSGDVSAKEALASFTCTYSSLPASVRVKDYDYSNPSLDVSSDAAVSAIGLGEISVYGDNFQTPEDGKRVAQLRAEELLASEAVFRGKGRVMHLRPGYLFELEDHPRGVFNTEYLVTDIMHWGNQAGAGEVSKLVGLDHSDVYRVELAAVPQKVQYRHPRATPKPRIYGMVGAVIDGAASSQYAQIDSSGRYRVKIGFDESDLKGGKASTTVRMLQPHGGSPEGFHFPLRKGTEVLLVFLGGDPDRPVIAGVAPNAQKPSPVGAGNHMLNVINTGGNNRIEMDDKGGAQRVCVSTPSEKTFIHVGTPSGEATHNISAQTGGNCMFNIGTDENITVGASQTIKIGTSQAVAIGTSQVIAVGTTLTETVGAAVKETYKDNYTKTVTGISDVTVTGAVKETFKTGQTTKVTGGDVDQNYSNQHKVKIGQGRTEEITGVVKETVTGSKVETVTTTVKQTYTGAHTIETGPRTEKVNGLYTQDIGGLFKRKADSEDTFWTGLSKSATGGASMTFKLGLNYSASVSLDYSFKASAGIAINVGLNYKLSASMDIDIYAFKFDQKAMKFESSGLIVDQRGTKVEQAGPKINVVAIFIVA